MLYLLGPGVGESAVLALPDGKFVVVDVCKQDHTNLPLALLDHLGAPQLDLLVVTHPDLDHIHGLAEVIQRRPPVDLWRYPMEASVRDLLAAWAGRTNRRQDGKALEAMRTFLKNGPGDVYCAAYGNLTWPPNPTATPTYTLSALAPTEYDKDRANRVLMRLMTKKKSALDAWLDGVARGEKPGDSPNVISVALVLELGEHRVLLGGDVLKGTHSPRSGWKGILRLLRKHGREHLLTDVAAVKVPHHGSRGAFEPTVWALHAAKARPIALIAPFSPSGLPDQATLTSLKPFARQLFVTAPHASLASFAASAGWVSARRPSTQSGAPIVALRIHPRDGVTECFVGGAALMF